MQNLPIFPADPVSLSFATDRVSNPSDSNLDAVWQLKLEPKAPLVMQTSFGLRVQEFQLFPVFTLNKISAALMTDFFSAPRLESLLPNYVRLIFSPQSSCRCHYELWVDSDHTLLGRCTVTNESSETIDFGIQIAAKLIPFGTGNGMHGSSRDHKTFLISETDKLNIALVMDTIPKAVLSPNPALEWTSVIAPAESAQLQWRCCAFENTLEGLNEAFAPFHLDWDDQIKQLETLYYGKQIEIATPNSDWDHVFQSVQNQAQLLLYRSNLAGFELGFNAQRNPNSNPIPPVVSAGLTQTASPRFEVLQLMQLIQVLLPTQPLSVKSLIEHFFGQLSASLAQQNGKKGELPIPYLCQIIWQTFTVLQDPGVLKLIFPVLQKVIQAWFSPAHDRDQDGLPEWDSLDQTGLKTLRAFNLLSPDDLPAHISTTESLDLGYLLLKELSAMQRIAQFLKNEETERKCLEWKARLQSRLASQEELKPVPLIVDRDSHRSSSRQLLFKGNLSDLAGRVFILSEPGRLNLQLSSPLQLRKPAMISLQGKTPSGEALEEVIPSEDILWLPGYFFAYSKNIYSKLTALSVPEMPDGRLVLYTADFSSRFISHFLGWHPQGAEDSPPSPASDVLEGALQACHFGLPEQISEPENGPMGPVNLAWNTLIITDLIEKGEKKLAFEIFKRLMAGVIQELKTDHLFSEAFSSSDARAVGARNSVSGLIPIQILLDLAGIKLFNSQKVSISGENALPWPITLRLKGLTVTRDGKNTSITFPDGSQFHHYGNTPRLFQARESS